MKAWIALLALAACGGGGGSSDFCLDAYHNLTRLDAFGGKTSGADGAFTVGLACKVLMSADLACIAKAKDQSEVGRCKGVTQLIVQKSNLVHTPADDGAAPADPAAVVALSQAVCACHDLSCLVGVAEQQATSIEAILKAGKPTDPAAVDASAKLTDCVGQLK